MYISAKVHDTGWDRGRMERLDRGGTKKEEDGHTTSSNIVSFPDPQYTPN